MNLDEATIFVRNAIVCELGVEPNEYTESTRLIELADSLEMAAFAVEIEDSLKIEIEIKNMSTFTVGQLIAFVVDHTNPQPVANPLSNGQGTQGNS